MTGLDVADLVVIASGVLGCDAGTALDQADVVAAEAALALAGLAGRPGLAGDTGAPGGARADRAEAAEAAVALIGALLRHPPFPAHREQIAIAAGLQFLAVNGWQAHLDVPMAAVIIIGRLAAGELNQEQVTAWLLVRLTPDSGSPAGEARSPVAQLVRAVRRRSRRRTRLRPFLIHVGPGHGPGGIVTPVSGAMPFTGHASRALALVRQEFSQLGGPGGPEHILLGVAGTRDSLAAQVLEQLGVSPEAVREQVDQATPPEPGDFQQTRRVWQAMVDEALVLGDDYIGTEHFLLALYCDRDSTAAQVLTRLGAGEREVRAAIAELVAEAGRERFA